MAGLEGKGRSGIGSLEHTADLQSHVTEVLHRKWLSEPLFALDPMDRLGFSGVLLLLARMQVSTERPPEVCVVLNKRSRKVRQAGDLCCPGGTVECHVDRYLAKVLSLPGFPLARWCYWHSLRRRWPREARRLALLFATGIRESWEEMRLNPLRVRFLGPLPSERLILFQRVIYPMVGWIESQHRFRPSWEVEQIISIPLRDLLDPRHYARYRLHISPDLEEKLNRRTEDLPCFIYQNGNQTELLWGATYRIVVLFLELVFGFSPPELESLHLVPGLLDEAYLHSRERR